MSTNFWVSPADKTVVVAMVQIIPYTQGRQEGGGEGGREVVLIFAFVSFFFFVTHGFAPGASY